MQGIELIVALLLASTVLAGVARAIHVHYAIVLVLGGLAVGLVSGTSAPQVDPHTVLFVFLPPLIYAASFSSSTQDLRAHARAIGLLAVGLVLLSMTAVAAVAHAVAGIGWGPALVLGAILGPTDPIAATSVLRRLGAPDRISTILEGEALINDGTGLTVYKLAVAAVVSGHFSPGAGIVKFIAVAAGGVAVGLAAGWVSVEIRKRIDEPQIEISISLLTAYLAYIPADRIGASGVLAAVAAGLYTGGRAGSMLSPTSRLRTLGFWEALTFLLESVLFLLIGLELPHITRRSVRGKAASIFGSGPRHPHRDKDGLDVHGPAAGTARPPATPPNAAGIAPRGTDRSRLERDARRRIARSRASATPDRGWPSVPGPRERDLHQLHRDRRNARDPGTDAIPPGSPARAQRRRSGRPRGGPSPRAACPRRAQAHRGSRSSRQGCDPAGESPAMLIVRVEHVATPHPVRVTGRAMRGVNGPAAWRSVGRCGGSSLGV